MADKPKKRSNRERFVRLAEKRVNNTVKNIQLIGNLSNTNNYTYTQKDVDRIFRTLDQELRAARSRFHPRSSGKATTFTLDD